MKQFGVTSAVQGGAKRRAGICGALATRKKRQRQNRLPDLIFYDHHQSRIVVVRIVVALFSQLSDCVLGTRKCRRYIRQVCASRVILDPCPSAYRKEILRHSTFAHYVEDQPRYRDRMAVFSWARLNHGIAGCGVKPRLAGDGGGKRRAVTRGRIEPIKRSPGRCSEASDRAPCAQRGGGSTL